MIGLIRSYFGYNLRNQTFCQREVAQKVNSLKLLTFCYFVSSFFCNFATKIVYSEIASLERKKSKAYFSNELTRQFDRKGKSE